MLKPERTSHLFAEAHATYAEGIKYLEEATKLWDRELLRKSAEKTWCAALLATNAFILARTGVEPEPDHEEGTYSRLTHLRKELNDWETLIGRYATLSHDIYQTAVCEKNVEPVFLLIHDIHDTADYIRDVERLAGI